MRTLVGHTHALPGPQLLPSGALHQPQAARHHKPFRSLKVSSPRAQLKTSTTATSKQTKAGSKSLKTTASSTSENKGRFYFNFTGFPFPLGPVFQRNTLRREVEKGSVWVFEQTQALESFSVYTPVRMTVIKLKSGGLWVHAPVAPTDECLALLKELDGPVEYIVLPTFAYEHKIFVGPFSRKFPSAKVYVTPYLWSFPLNLPPQFFGIFPAGVLMDDDKTLPWSAEIEQKTFLPPTIGTFGSYIRTCEVAFYHKRSRTLMVTDAVIYIPSEPPQVIPRQGLLDAARDGWLARYVSGDLSSEEVKQIANTQPVADTPENRRRGWMRMTLLVLFFMPFNLLQPDSSFKAISDRLIVGPVVETLVYSKVPRTVTAWVDSICKDWNFKQIIPCHFDAPIPSSPEEFRRAFSFAYDELDVQGEPSAAAGWTFILASFLRGSKPRTRVVVFPDKDMMALRNLNNTLISSGAVKRDAEV